MDLRVPLCSSVGDKATSYRYEMTLFSFSNLR